MGYRIVKCKTCRSEIARSANVCPHCGAKQHQVANAIAGLVIFAVLITIWGAWRVGMNRDKIPTVGRPEPTIERTKEDVRVSSIMLWNAYENNVVDADNLYKDKVVAVTGKIVDISQDVLTDAPMVALTNGKSLDLQPIQCFFPKNTDQNERLSNLKDGQEITIIGICNGLAVIHVQLSDCYLP